MIKQERMQIIKQQQIAHHIFELTVKGVLANEMAEPGQFVHIRVADSFEPLLRRPISVASIDLEASQFTMIYRAEGRGTQLLAEKRAGDTLDVLGPLGHGFPVEEAVKKAYLIGGGIGVPPLYELAKQLNARGIETVHILGFESKQAVFYEEKFRGLGDTHIATVDGSHGTQGFVTHILNELPADFDTYYSCGPTAMLEAVQWAYPQKKGFLSYEQRMGCGIGACFACVCRTTKSETDYIKVCSDGPVFPAGVVIS
ncbi:dihydroorotate dehydrogenase electron transfer subunit [Planococcus kocurii]|uniref:Dihydroorotate dehydrogenase B (NAD(+)), electron transfer subunit n=1 Tax=Planococcus kocurii TaxID=1374 RepID=A0ABM5WV62_9BACL|nr:MULTISPECIES: dihydroorotate dehydrogenase electron transfer subunit [Planococcus]ALS78222.1 dihydroorotate dehydrogenase [Planococcus kocurii]KAA0958386.1 dihydroorotate dehydrogenase electron transfer subunit [Planococcus sp. ANT_H30]